MIASHGGETGTATAGTGATTPLMMPPPAVTLPPITGGMRWSEPATWGGRVPPDGAKVTIEAGKTVILDVQTASLDGLTIKGTLVADPDKDVGITSAYIYVDRGRMQIGSEQTPFTHGATITLTGSSATDNPDTPGMGNKGLVVMDGVLELHGRRAATAWTRLNADAAPGAKSLVLDEAPGWNAGDQIVVATSSTTMDEYDASKIVAIDGKSVTLESPLAFKHLGTKAAPTTGITVDVRAEVGLLTHNIVVQGDASSTTNKVGGHTMFMATTGTTIQIDGVEFRAMGQFNNLGRYPVHFHVMRDRCHGCYVKNSAVHDTVQRGIVVHDSAVTVQGNVVFKTVGHNYIVETLTTEGSVIDRNLGLVNAAPNPKFTEPTLATQNDFAPSNFWMKSTRNVVTNNHAAGAFSAGFIYDSAANGPAYFKDNVAHAAMDRGGDAFPTGAGFTSIVNRAGSPDDVLEGFVGYHNAQGFWPEIELEPAATEQTAPLVSKSFVLYDNGINIFGRGPGNRARHESPTLIGSLGVFNQYGGEQTLIDPLIVNVKGSLVSGHDTNPQVGSFVIVNPKLVNSAKILPDERSWVVFMDDSSIPKGAYVHKDQPFFVTSECSIDMLPGEEAPEYYHCPRRYGFSEMDVRDLSAPATPLHTTMKIKRSDGLEFYSLGYQGAEVKFVGGNRGYLTLFDAGVSYALPKASTKGWAVRLTDTDAENPNSQVLAEKATVQVSIPVSGPPTGVFRKGTSTKAPDATTAADALKRVASVAELAASPLTSYYYDGNAKLVWVHASTRWTTVVP